MATITEYGNLLCNLSVILVASLKIKLIFFENMHPGHQNFPEFCRQDFLWFYNRLTPVSLILEGGGNRRGGPHVSQLSIEGGFHVGQFSIKRGC